MDTHPTGPRWSAEQWREANTLLQSRSGGRCEVCGVAFKRGDKVVRHHRQRRAIGGDRMSNILLIHDPCHLRVHAHPEEAREAGWIVSAYLPDPADVPVAYQRGRLILLDDVGAMMDHL